jgi:hypothetical protein
MRTLVVPRVNPISARIFFFISVLDSISLEGKCLGVKF